MVDNEPLAFVAGTGHVAAINGRTGAIIWQDDLHLSRIGGYAIEFFNGANGTIPLVLIGGNGKVDALDVRTGKLIYQAKLSGVSTVPVAMVLEGNTLFVTSGHHAFSFSLPDMHLQWDTRVKNSNILTSIGLQGEHLIIGQGSAVAVLNAMTGAKVWIGPIRLGKGLGKAAFMQVVPYENGTFLAAGANHLVCANTATGELIWQMTLGQMQVSSTSKDYARYSCISIPGGAQTTINNSTLLSAVDHSRAVAKHGLLWAGIGAMLVGTFAFGIFGLLAASLWIPLFMEQNKH